MACDIVSALITNVCYMGGLRTLSPDIFGHRLLYVSLYRQLTYRLCMTFGRRTQGLIDALCRCTFIYQHPETCLALYT
jgi:hypothetical protein